MHQRYHARARLLRVGCALTLIGLTAAKPVLVSAFDPQRIDIIPTFKGTDLLLFGAMVDGDTPNPKPSDIIVVLRGPSQEILVREKQKFAGLIWANAHSARFRSAPAYYALASTRPVTQILDARTAAIYELGLDNLHLSPADSDIPATRERFERGLIALKQASGLYLDLPRAVAVSGGLLYRARLPIPSSVPTGIYTAETLLVRDGRVLAAATRDIEVRKIGVERTIESVSRRQPLLYGLAAVCLSLAFGWGVSLIFRRR